jgi:cation diffusion facilitator CzcD-associated flavoprotein CzcO
MQPRIAIIGAGCSGLAALKNCLDAGLQDVVCFEKNAALGGNWRYSPEEGHSSVCETTHIISSKKMSEFPDFPMPEDYPDYPSHEQVLRYFEDYADHFGLLPHIRFRSGVSRAEKIAGGRWRLTLDDGQTGEFDFLLVANGHHSEPRHPEYPGAFTGDYLHAHGFKHPRDRRFEGKRVLVIGAGNSGCDCSVEISRTAAFVAISLRKGQYIVPKFFLGRPTDTFNRSMRWLPGFLADPLRRFSLWLQVGDYRDYGLPKPEHPLLSAHPTVNSELLYKIKHGKVHPRPGIVGWDGKTVRFADGRAEEYDTVVAATGYKLNFPFFGPELSGLDFETRQRVSLYLRMFHPEHPTLVFIGLVQPQGAIWPLSNAQGRLAARYMTGKWKLPDDLRERAEKDADRIARRFLKESRHTVEVHFQEYLDSLEKEARRRS